MKLRTLKERELIAGIRKDFFSAHPDLLLGIGDDAAVIKGGKKSLILTKDLLVEDYHFLLPHHPPFLLGRKSLNVNVSDISAMGGVPLYTLLGLGLSSRISPAWVEDFFSGLRSAAHEQKILLIGGDISQAKKVFISLTLIGEGKNPVRRDGAKPNHLLFVSGTLGDSRQGLLLMKKGVKLGASREGDFVLKAFFDPVPQVSLGKELSRLRAASSMIDISDGLSVDVTHLCEESRCGAEIYLERLPLSPALRSLQKRPYECALHGGEDYQLLFTVPAEKKQSVLKLQRTHKLTEIGQMVNRKGVFVVDRMGKRTELKVKGYQHFNKE